MNELLHDEVPLPEELEQPEEVKAYYVNIVSARREQLMEELKNPAVDELIRDQLLASIEEHWTEHLTTMNTLKEGIHLRSYGQEQPVRMYEKEGFEIFNYTIAEIEYPVAYVLQRLSEYIMLDEEIEEMELDV